MRRWRNLPFRRGSYWLLPSAAQPGVPQQPQRRTARLGLSRRGRFFPAPVPAAAVTVTPAQAPPLLAQHRRAAAALSRRRLFPVIPAAPLAPPGPFPGRHPRLAGRPPRGRFLAVPVPVPVTGAPGPLVPPHLHQRRAQPLRIPRSHRADPPWAGQAAPAPTPPAPQLPRQAPARARLPRRGCLFAVPPGAAHLPPPFMRRPAARPVQARRGCLFRNPPAVPPAAPGPLIPPVIRPAGSRPRWPARPRRGCQWIPALIGAPPPPFSIGALTASGAPGAVLTASGASAALTAGTAPGSTLIATDQRTGGPG